MPNKDFMVVFVLLDGSGSMSAMKDTVISGFREFIEDQKKLSGNVMLSMVQFSSSWNNSLDYRTLYHFTNLKEIDYKALDSYSPHGGTPLLSAMDTAIDELGQDLEAMPEEERPSKVLFMTITDGQENTSDKTKVSKHSVGHKVQHQTKIFKWEFLYIGANQDSFAEAGGLGVSNFNTTNYTANVKGMTVALAAASASTASYSTTGATLNMSYTYDTLARSYDTNKDLTKAKEDLIASPKTETKTDASK